MSNNTFTKDNLDIYLKALAKEFRKRNGTSMPAEITMIGGASVLINYGFRDRTYDMDVIINASSVMKDAINAVGDRYGLPNGWMNTDFMKTDSYTSRIVEFSTYYRTYSNIVTFRTVTGEYLVAMKLMAGRQYKNDLSDVIGILAEHVRRGKPLSIELIRKAAQEMYGSYDCLPDTSRAFIEKAIETADYEKEYERIRQMESENMEILLEFQEEYKSVVNKDNVNEILDRIRNKRGM